MRILDFTDGFESAVQPTAVGVVASEIGVTPAGNLASTNVQAALTEHQGDIDTLNTSVSALDGRVVTLETHPNDTTNVHGIADTTALSLKTATETLSGKTFSDPITLTEQGSAPSTPSAGLKKIYAKNDGKVYTIDSTGLERQVGSGTGGGAKNYLGSVNGVDGNGDFELGSTSKWSLGNVALTSAFPSGVPTFGSGAHANLAIAAVTSDKLAGSYSLSYASSSATTAGNFLASDAFTIDIADQAKVLTFKFFYKGVTTPANANWSGTNANSFGVAIYDVTNAAWIMPAGAWGMTQSSGVGIATGTFQTTSNSTQYRLVVFNANATSGAVTLYFDDMSIGPQTAPIGSAEAYLGPLTTTGSWSTNTTYVGKYWRDADFLVASVLVTLGGLPTSASLTLTLPSGLVIDTAKLNVASSNQKLEGGYRAIDAGSNTSDGFVTYNTTTSIALYRPVTATGDAFAEILTGNGLSQAAPFAFNSTDSISIWYRVPISGWSSNVQMSNDTDTRVLAMYALSQAATGTVSAAFNIAKLGTVAYDTHAAYNTTTGIYTVPVTGFYRLSGTINISATFSAGHAVGVQVGNLTTSKFHQGWLRAYGAVSDLAPTATGIVFANANDQLAMYSWSQGTTPSYVVTTAGNYLSIERLSGPAVVAATESVSARYCSTTVTLTNSTQATVTFTTKSFDSHNAYSGGVYTIPVSGKYRFAASLTTNGFAATAIGNNFQVIVQKNSTDYSVGIDVAKSTSASILYTAKTADSVDCVAGDTIRVQYFHNLGATPTIAASATLNSFSIERVGN